MALVVDAVNNPVLLRNVLLHLCPKDVCKAAQTSKTWLEVAQDEYVWSHIARSRYPAELVNRAEYPSWRALVLDDNSRNLVHTLDGTVRNSSCLFQHNTEEGFYQCRVMGAELSHTHGEGHSIRIAYDARGERDLRNPTSSVLHLLLQPPISSSDLGGPSLVTLATVYCSSILEACSHPAHYKGVLEWAPADVQTLSNCMSAAQAAIFQQADFGQQVAELPQAFRHEVHDVYHSCPELLQQGSFVLGFQFGHCPGEEASFGYSVVQLLQVPVLTGSRTAAGLLVDTWRQKAAHGPRGTLEQAVLDSSGDKAWWDSVLPAGVKARDEWWVEPKLRSAAPGWEKNRPYADAWAEGQEWGMQWGIINLDDNDAIEQAVEWLQGGLLDDWDGDEAEL